MLKDQIELLSALNDHGVEYMVVGGHAVNAHACPGRRKISTSSFARAIRAAIAYSKPLCILERRSAP